ncbi:hypothetical protein [Nocardia yamanashiensis]|uniref:hypothetical protein n=1 Tax=Nocardia yamanashiensis TaxID=209247 RepID=UPI00083622D5|nr:hypothetical protein [Nocardia yamanashiensis]
MDTEDYLKLIRALLDDSPESRDRAADECTDQIGAYDPEQETTLLHMLLWSAQVETSPTAMESELNAACAIVSAGAPSSTIAAPLSRIDRSKLTGSAIEHYDYLVGESGRTA